MKQRIIIFVVVIFLAGLLAALNAATYVQKDKTPDTELAPNRSTYNPGSTGTQALYSLLAETGRNVTRWRSSLETIASDTKSRPSVFVMIGPLRRELTDTEQTELMQWVASGGTLVLIDRQPAQELTTTTTQWQLRTKQADSADLFFVDGSDQTQMTAGTAAQKPTLPSLFSHGVNAVQPSRFASTIELERINDPASYKPGESSKLYTIRPEVTPTPTPQQIYSGGDVPPPPPTSNQNSGFSISGSGLDEDEPSEDDRVPAFEAPLIHIGTGGQNLLVEAPFAEGRVIVLSDPYIVSNNGINLADNSRLAVNLVASREGLIAFDEYHHGYGADNNRFFQYFEGTPVIAIFLQCAVLVALLFLSQSRRFARPVPEPESDRLSKLEYVSAMAELQQRTQAYDLAIENIYADFRRRVCSLVGLDNTTASRRDIAERIGERTGDPASSIEELMLRCENVIHGDSIGRSETVSLVEQVRGIEEKLGLKRSGRTGL